ncbi:DNA polymerase subunit beta [Streptomyces filamentosus]|uniref:DNA polymerase subunit beta n=1 Tax=Streptomyces filamentosus TaxID=67294 RepID=UPI0033DD4671
MEFQYDVVIAGAGPAGLACAQALQTRAPRLRVLLLEAGRTFRRRPCPVDRGLRCTGCGGVCNVISGFGGSLHYGDGAKLSLLPSGRRLITHFGEETAQSLCVEAYAWLTSGLPQPPALAGEGLSERAVSSFSDFGLSIREYPVAVVGERDLERIIETCHDGLRAECLHLSEVTDAQPHRDGGMTVTVRTHHGVEEVHAGHVVLATGRRGVTATAALLRRLGVPMTPPDLSVGVRFEMDARLLAEIGTEHPDLKISQQGTAVTHKVKTFCFCGGPNGGRLKFTHYHEAFGPAVITLDGHETTDRLPSGRPLAANFGLLSQVQGRGDAVQAQQSFLGTYRRLADGRPFTQTLGNFLNRSPETRSWPELEASLPYQPSVLDLTTGPVYELFTLEEHTSLAAGLDRVMGSILKHAGHAVSLRDLADQVLVVAPELEFVWEQPALDAGCKVPDLPVYVVGDAAGIAQGIVQGAMMGTAAARTIAAEELAAPAGADR